MDALFSKFNAAVKNTAGYDLAETLSPIPPAEHPDQLRAFARSTNIASVEKDLRSKFQRRGSQGLRFSNDEEQAWIEIYLAFWRVINELIKLEAGSVGQQTSWTKVYELWKDLTNKLIRGYTNQDFEAWTVPCLYVTGKYMRIFAIKADQEPGSTSSSSQAGFQDDFAADSAKNEKLEDAARMLNRIFQICLSDRAPLEESRKWGIYNIINLLFKTYFRLNSVSLSKNIISALRATRGDMPDIVAFPMAHQVTFNYYLGVIHFLEENYVEAENSLTTAFRQCHRDAKRNRELILTYLIPCHLLTTHTLPTEKLLEPYPRLQKLFLPLSRCIKRGDLSGFNEALLAGEDEFVKRRIYLTLERGRDIALRNLLRKVFIAGGFDEQKDPSVPPIRRTRVPVAEFAAAISLGSKESIENDEVECLLANMIYKNLMKGYIARDRGIVVLSKGGAFPGTGL